MARSRNIKPGFFVNDELAEIDPLGRILFIGLWTIADREGRLEDRPKKIRAEVLPFDDCDVEALLAELAKREFIVRYEVKGKKYIQVTNFSKHQRPHMREMASTIPPCPDHETQAAYVSDEEEMPADDPVKVEAQPRQCPGTTQAQPEHNLGSAEASPRCSDSLNLIPDSLNPRTDTLNRIPDTRKVTRAGARIRTHAREPSMADSRFDEFWEAYPKRVGRGAAEKAYERIHPTAELQGQMLAAVSIAKKSRQWQENNGQYIPNPATWLNQRRWEDDPSPAIGPPAENPQVNMAQEAIEAIMNGAG